MRGPIGDLRDFSCHLRLWFTFFSLLLLEGIFSLCATELCTSDLHVEFVCAQMTSPIKETMETICFQRILCTSTVKARIAKIGPLKLLFLTQLDRVDR